MVKILVLKKRYLELKLKMFQWDMNGEIFIQVSFDLGNNKKKYKITWQLIQTFPFKSLIYT